METNPKPLHHRKRIAAIIAVCSIVVLLFIFFFSLFHLPERDPIETPQLAENPNYVASPAADFQETLDINSATPEQVSEMLGELEMQYANAQLNSEPYAAQQAGMRLALAYEKAGQIQQADSLILSLKNQYGYDDAFVTKCNEFLKNIHGNGE